MQGEVGMHKSLSCETDRGLGVTAVPTTAMFRAGLGTLELLPERTSFFFVGLLPPSVGCTFLRPMAGRFLLLDAVLHFTFVFGLLHGDCFGLFTSSSACSRSFSLPELVLKRFFKTREEVFSRYTWLGLSVFSAGLNIYFLDIFTFGLCCLSEKRKMRQRREQ